MKKLGLILLLITLTTFAFAANGALVYDSANSTNSTNVSQTLTYSLTTKAEAGSDPGTSVVNSYNIGFATDAVSSLDDNVTDLGNPSYTLTVSSGTFVGTLAEDLYVYWQIASPVACDISLTPTKMTDGGTNDLHIKFSTTNHTTYLNVAPTAYAEVDTETATDDTARTKTILSYTPSDSNNYQAAGSQKISITTHSIEGLATGSYSGTLTLNVQAK